jgi:hypothetical protein
MANPLRKYLMSSTGLISYTLIGLSSYFFKEHISTGIEDYIAFMYVKIYGAGILFCILFILIFSWTYKKMEASKILLFILVNSVVYVGMIYLISDPIAFLPETRIVINLRLLILPAIGAFLFLFFLRITASLKIKYSEYAFVAFIGLLPSLYKMVQFPLLNNRDRGQYIISPWQFLIPLGVALILLLKDKQNTDPLLDLPAV